jgi:hypothetical protein
VQAIGSQGIRLAIADVSQDAEAPEASLAGTCGRHARLHHSVRVPRLADRSVAAGIWNYCDGKGLVVGGCNT